MLAGLAPLWASASRPAVGSWARRRRAPDTLNLLCLRRFLAAVLRIVCVRSSPSSPSVPPGPAARESSLRRSYLAYFLEGISRTLPSVDRPPSATAPQASPAAKKQRGERGSWPVT